MNYDHVEKINKLAATLRNTGLCANMAEAVEKAKEIILGKNVSKSAQEIERDVHDVEEELRDDLKKNGVYFPAGDDSQEQVVEVEEPQPKFDEFVKEHAADIESGKHVGKKSKQPVESAASVAQDIRKDLDDIKRMQLEPDIKSGKIPVTLEVYEREPDTKEQEPAEIIVDASQPAPKAAESSDFDNPDYDVTKEEKTVDELFSQWEPKKDEDLMPAVESSGKHDDSDSAHAKKEQSSGSKESDELPADSQEKTVDKR